MSTRAALAVALSAVVLLSTVGPVSGVATVERSDAGPAVRSDAGPANWSDAGPTNQSDGGSVDRIGDGFAQYKVSLDNVTVEVWMLRNATLRNATVREAVVRNVTTPNGSRTNVTLSNVSVSEFDVTNATLLNVSAERLVVRNKSVLSIPGGGFIDPNINNRIIDDHTTKNATVSGVVIDRISVDAGFLCGNATLGARGTGNASYETLTPEDKPDIVVEDGTVDTAVVVEGHAENWSVESASQGGTSNASNLPNGCTRGG